MSVTGWLGRTILAAFAVTAIGCANDQGIKMQAQQAHTGLASAVVNEDEVNKYLQDVGGRIIAAARQLNSEGYQRPKDYNSSQDSWMFGDEMKFVLVNNDKVNAVTTGGNYMYVYNGFLQQCRSEEELAAVLSHEFAHVYMRHIHNKVNAQGISQFGTISAMIGGAYVTRNEDAKTQEETAKASGQLAQEVGKGVLNNYSRDEEGAADRVGFQFYTRAGWDPAKFADVFQSQLDKTGSAPAGAAAAAGGATDHPPLEERIANAQQRASQLPPEASNWKKSTVASSLQFRKVKDRAATAVASMPASDSLTQAQTALGVFSSCFADSPEKK